MSDDPTKAEAPQPDPLLEQLDAIFTYHPPKGDQSYRYGLIRASAQDFARTICMYVPPCADRTAAIRKIREAVMTANAAIALEGKV